MQATGEGKDEGGKGTVCSKRFVHLHLTSGLTHQHYTALKSRLQISFSFLEA